MTVTLALAGDTMLGRGVARRLDANPDLELLAPAVREAAAAADLFVLNLECCISDRGAPFPDPGKPFFFRAPPVAAQRLADVGVDGVTLANNHALDFGPDALLDTLDHLRAAGVAVAGAGPDVAAARAPMVLEGPAGVRVRVVTASDHPAAFAATEHEPGIAYADLARGVPDWLAAAAAPGRGAGGEEIVLVSPHWGPNMCSEPVAHVVAAAGALLEAGATLVAGHSAHVFHGVAGRVLHDLGDFVDDYAVDRALRNDLGFLWLVTLDAGGPRRLEALPLALGYARTDVARGADAAWALGRLRALSAALGTDVDVEAGRAVVRW